MTPRAKLKQGLIAWVARLASPEYPHPMPEGTVTWFNRAEPFISDCIQAGIYLRILSFKSPGKDGFTQTTNPTTGNLIPNAHSNGTIRLQIQAKSLEATDDQEADAWLGNLSDRFWSEDSKTRLLALGCAPISTGTITILDGILDDRAASVANFEVVLHWATDVLGSELDPIEHVSGSGSVGGSFTDIGFQA
jgi:hypothetical protein